MAKSAAFGALHVVTSFAVTYALTGSVAIAGAITFVEPLVNTVLHHVFDRYWDHPRALRLRAGLASRWSDRHPGHRGRVSRSSASSQAIA